MTDPVIIELPGEPKGKGRPRFGKGRAYTPASTKSYETALAWAAKDAMKGRPLMTGPIDLRVVAWIEIPKSWPKEKQDLALRGLIRPTVKPDSDNITKIVADALKGIAFKDDAQIVDDGCSKKYARNPSVWVSVRELAVADLWRQPIREAAE